MREGNQTAVKFDSEITLRLTKENQTTSNISDGKLNSVRQSFKQISERWK